MRAWTRKKTRLLTCSCASCARSSPTPARARTTSKPCGAGATSYASPNHSRWQAESDHPSEQYGPGGIGDTSRLLVQSSALKAELCTRTTALADEQLRWRERATNAAKPDMILVANQCLKERPQLANKPGGVAVVAPCHWSPPWPPTPGPQPRGDPTLSCQDQGPGSGR